MYYFAVNHKNMTEDMLNEEFTNKKKEIQQQKAIVTVKEHLENEILDLESYEILIEVVNDIEFKTAICQMEGKVYECSVCDIFTNSLSIYYYGKWKNVPVVVVQTGKRVGSQFQYGSWFETKKALYA